MKKVRAAVLIVTMTIMMLQGIAYAECWIVSKLKGYQTLAAEQYSFVDSGFSKPFRINIDGNNSSVEGWDNVTFVEITPQLLMGVYKSGGYQGSVDVWGIDTEKRKVFYTQAKSGFSIFDGTKMFIGKIDGKCK